MGKQKDNVGSAIGNVVGNFMENIVGGVNTIFINYKVTVFELLLAGLAFAEMTQGIFTVEVAGAGEVVGSPAARAGGHIIIFLIGLVSALIYAKEIADVAKAFKVSRELGGNYMNVLVQLFQAVLVIVIMLASVIGQTMIVLAIYDSADFFWEVFRQNPIQPLWAMIEKGSFPLMTTWVAFFHVLLMVFVGMKQLGDEDFGIGKKEKSKEKKEDKKDDKSSMKTRGERRKESSDSTAEKLYKIIHRYDSSVSKKAFYANIDDEAEHIAFLNFIQKGGGSQRDKTLAVLEYAQITNNNGALLAKHEPAIKAAVNKELGK